MSMRPNSPSESITSSSRYQWNPYDPVSPKLETSSLCGTDDVSSLCGGGYSSRRGDSPTPPIRSPKSPISFAGLSLNSLGNRSFGQSSHTMRLYRPGSQQQPLNLESFLSDNSTTRGAKNGLSISEHVSSSELDDLVNSLRKEPTDAHIQGRIDELQASLKVTMIAYCLGESELIETLIKRERGNIITQAMKSLKGCKCDTLVHYFLEHGSWIVFSQSGCIAFTRILESSTVSQRVHLVQYTMDHFMEFSLHEYGNYVVQSALRYGDGRIVCERTKELLPSATTIASLCANKFGSHVMETIVQRFPEDHVCGILRNLFGDEEVLRCLSEDRFGNYVVQHSIKRVRAISDLADLLKWCCEHVPMICGQSQFLTNILRALGHESSGQKSKKGKEAKPQ